MLESAESKGGLDIVWAVHILACANNALALGQMINELKCLTIENSKLE